MRLLHLFCKSCGSRFESGVPLQREHLEGAKVRTLEVCPVCGAAADYHDDDYFEPGDSNGSAAGLAPPGTSDTRERPS